MLKRSRQTEGSQPGIQDPSNCQVVEFWPDLEMNSAAFLDFGIREIESESLAHLPRVAIFYFMKGFVGNFCIFSVGACMGFFSRRVVSPTINPYGLIGFTTQKYTHFFGK